MIDHEYYERIMDRYADRYRDILEYIWPTIGSNGFAERNQTINFAAAYEAEAVSRKENTHIWYEFQIPNVDTGNDNNHIDGLLLNESKHELMLIEAKRISKNKTKEKEIELCNDFDRILKLDIKSRLKEMFDPEPVPQFSVRGCLLFDVWDESLQQIELVSRCDDCEKNSKIKRMADLRELFSQISIGDQVDYIDNEACLLHRKIKFETWKYTYHLGCVIWEIKMENTKQEGHGVTE